MESSEAEPRLTAAQCGKAQYLRSAASQAQCPGMPGSLPACLSDSGRSCPQPAEQARLAASPAGRDGARGKSWNVTLGAPQTNPHGDSAGPGILASLPPPGHVRESTGTDAAGPEEIRRS